MDTGGPPGLERSCGYLGPVRAATRGALVPGFPAASSSARGRTRQVGAELDDEPVLAPDDDGRTLPLSIRAARAHVERWTITMPRPVEVLHARAREDTPWFRLTESLEIDEHGTTVVVETRFEPLADEVAAGDVAAYRTAFDRLQDAVDFELVDRSAPIGPESFARRFADTSGDESDALLAAELGAGLLPIGIAAVRRRREARPDDPSRT